MNGGSGARRWRQGLAFALLLGLLAGALQVTRGARLERADFVMNNGAEVQTLDPATVTGVPEGRVLYALFEGLVVKDPRTVEPLPGMARSWEISGDGRTYRFEMQPEARWSNGERLTAHDFEWSWKRLLHPETAAEYAYQLWYVRGARHFSELPTSGWYTRSSLWIDRAAEDEPWRVGLTGFAFERLLAEDGAHLRMAPDLRTGVRLAAGAPLFELEDGRTLALPFACTLGAIRMEAGGATRPDRAEPAPWPLTELAVDPYVAGWCVEIEPEEASFAAAQNAGELLPHELFRDEVAWEEVGIRAVSDELLVVELEAPTPFFLHLVGFYPLFPVNRRNIEEARRRWPDTWQVEWVRPENIVTNGPYVVTERRINDRIRLAKNEHYWDRDNVAMRTIDILAVEHYVTMLNLYLTGEVDWIDRCPPNLIPRLLPREDFNPRPYLGSYFYRVNVTRPPLDDPRVRRALALAIDRRAICEKILKKGEVPNWSLCPNGLPGYQRVEMDHSPLEPDLANYEEAFATDCEEARALLVEAGYGPDGEPFPTIELHFNTSEAHRDIAEVVADTWKRTLGIEAKLLNQEWKVYLDTQQNLEYDISRSAWIGDYADPNTFLDVFKSDGENNRTGWRNAEYDALIARSARVVDPTERMELLAAAEAILLEELPILPIFNYVTQNLVKPRLGGFYENVIDEHMPKFFYWRDEAELAETRAALPVHRERVPAGGPPNGLYAPNTKRGDAR